MRTTLIRLERHQTEDVAQALEQLQRHFEDLAAALIEAGRKRGYLGSDPMGALAHLCAPATEDLQLTRLVADLWRTFFAGFREDEQNFEAARFATAAGELNDRLNAMPIGQSPELRLAMDMLDALIGFWDDRQAALSQRIDQLIAELTTHQQQLGSAQLDQAYQSDELDRATTVVRAAVIDLGEQPDATARLTDLLGILVKRWRSELQTRRQEADSLRHLQGVFLKGLGFAASGKVPEDLELPETMARIIEEVADVVSGFREQEQAIRGMAQESARLRAEAGDKDREIANRDELIARYEFGEEAGRDEDRRLTLYRQAVAAWESGRDPATIIAEIRELERVLILDGTERGRTSEVIDRHLDGLVKTLGLLRRITALSEDPRRFRPRLFGATPYDLKKLGGLMQAARDAGRDLLVYVARARWAAGAKLLCDRFPRLKRIFKEMVRLVADCREQLGGPPPAAATLSIETLDGLASLPAVLAVDVKALGKARGARTYAGEVMDVLEETVATFNDTLAKARGSAIPRPEAPKRESQGQALVRLGDELIALAGLMESTFAEARANAWQPLPEEASLIEQEHILLLGLRDLDAICDCLTTCKGAPEPRFTDLPGGRRSDLDKILAGCRERVEWLEDVARYRVETPKG